MISRAIPSNSFYHTARYISQKPKAELLMAEGVRGHDYRLAAEDFLTQQEMRPSKTVACAHLSLSFHPKENPTDEKMKEIALQYLERIGIVNTQILIYKHMDRAHPHLHIMANMVNNEGKVISDSYLGLRGKKIAQKLTLEHKLILALKRQVRQIPTEQQSQLMADRAIIFRAISENLPACKSLDELKQKLAGQGIETIYKYKGQTQEKQGVSFRINNHSFKGSDIDRNFSLGGLIKTVGQNQQQEQQIQTSITRAEKDSTLDTYPIGINQKRNDQRKALVHVKVARRSHSFRRAASLSSPSYPSRSLNTGGGDLTAIGRGMSILAAVAGRNESAQQSMPAELSWDAKRKKKKKKRLHL